MLLDMEPPHMALGTGKKATFGGVCSSVLAGRTGIGEQNAQPGQQELPWMGLSTLSGRVARVASCQ